MPIANPNSTAAARKQQHFNDSYNDVDAPKVAQLDGATQWQRFELTAIQLTPRIGPDDVKKERGLLGK